jgi:DNA repair protein RecN (Recombination protein N)
MLQELTIKNLALIEQLNLNFKTGFTTLTGETGAGKSILLDGLGLALGERANATLVRHDTTRADVSANFSIANLNNVQQWLIEHELDDDKQCLLRRSLSSDGRSKAYINGFPVNINLLKQLSSLLIDIHGQHEHQSLLLTSKQLELLDSYAQHHDLTINVAQKYQTWTSIKKTLQSLAEKQNKQQNKLELLEFQLQEFNKITPIEHEFEEISLEHNALFHASEIKRAAYFAYQTIESEQGITEKINKTITELEKIAGYSPSLAQSTQQLHSALIDVQEIAADIHLQEQQIEADPIKLQQFETRLSELFSLSKKYQLEPEQLVQKHQQIQAELAELNSSTNSLEQLQNNLEIAWQDYLKTSKQLSSSRQKHAVSLAATITKNIKTLGMANGEFSITITTNEKSNSNGMDNIQFLISANKGQPMQAINKIASGGELSRISLAIQVVCAETTSLPTLIFDEIDVGIGGGIAEIVGQKMQLLGNYCQVLSITHLGQVAAYGKQQFNITKSSTNNSTITQVNELNKEQRIAEIARMVGGISITKQTIKHAKDFLTNAQKLTDTKFNN